MQHKNFFMVPNRIFDLELKPRDFTVYCCLLRHSDSKDGSCFPSRRVIAKECGMDRKTVDSAIENLSSLGLVKKIQSAPRGRNENEQPLLRGKPFGVE